MENLPARTLARILEKITNHLTSPGRRLKRNHFYRRALLYLQSL